MLDFPARSQGVWLVKAIMLRGVRFAALIGGLLAPQSISFAANPQAWMEVRSPHFIVVSNANEHEARRVAEQFEIIRAVLREHFGNVSVNDQPIIILAAKDENTLKPLLPEVWTKKGSAHRVGLYVNGADKSYVGLRLDVSLNQSAYEPYEPIYHEYVHYLMRRITPNVPRWMVEGLAEFYGNVRVERNRVLLGTPSTSNVMILREKTPLPLSTLFEVNASSPYYNEENKISIFYAESWALTHYLVVRDWREKTHRVNDFVALLLQKVPQTEAAQRTIGDPGELERRLDEYIHKSSFNAATLDRPKLEVGNFQTRPLSDAESLAVRADFMGRVGRYTEAQAMLEESLKLDPKLVAAYESMCLLSFRQGKTRDAEKWSRQALELNPHSYLANYYYSWSLLRGGAQDSDTVAKVEASLRTVIKSNPEFVPAYDALAECLARPGIHQKLEEAYKTVSMAVEREPGSAQYRIGAVNILERMGRAEDAIRVATLAVSIARTPEEKNAASASLVGAQQFQAWHKNMEDLKEAQKNNEQKPPTPLASATEAAKDRSPVSKGQGGLEVLTDTMGVDFSPYLNKEVLPRVKQNWYALIPESASWKKGRVVLEFFILKDGSVAGLKVVGSTGDLAMDRPAYGSITGSNPFPPLSKEFPGKSLGLRFSYYYNLNTDGSELDQKKPTSLGRECTAEDYLTSFLSSDDSTAVSIWPPSPVRVSLNKHQKFSAGGGTTHFAFTDWAITGELCKIADCGSISPVGLYAAPATMPPSRDIVVTVTETREPCRSGSVNVTLVPAQALP